MTEVITPEPCRRIHNGKQCGKMPMIINPEPGLYYAVCSCPGHKAHDGYYQFIGRTPQAALKQWNDWQLYGITHDVELLDRIAAVLGYASGTVRKQKGVLYERKNIRYSKKNKRPSVRDNKFSSTDYSGRKTGIDGSRCPYVPTAVKYES